MRSATRAGWLTGAGDVHDRVPDVDPLRPRGDEGEEDLRCRLVRVVLEEMVLGRPVVLEAGGIDGFRDLELAQKACVLVVTRRNVHLREDPELHSRTLLAA